MDDVEMDLWRETVEELARDYKALKHRVDRLWKLAEDEGALDYDSDFEVSDVDE